MSGGTQISKTTYAGGTETRQRRLNTAITLDIVITETDRVRLTENRETGEVYLHWMFADHLSSCRIQTDWEGRITSQEEYAYVVCLKQVIVFIMSDFMYEVAKKMAIALVFFIINLPIRWKITRSYIHAA